MGAAPANPLAQRIQSPGSAPGGATKRFEAGTAYQLLAIAAVIATIDSFVWTLD